MPSVFFQRRPGCTFRLASVATLLQRRLAGVNVRYKDARTIYQNTPVGSLVYVYRSWSRLAHRRRATATMGQCGARTSWSTSVRSYQSALIAALPEQTPTGISSNTNFWYPWQLFKWYSPTPIRAGDVSAEPAAGPVLPARGCAGTLRSLQGCRWARWPVSRRS